MAHFGRNTEGFSASQTVRIVDTETVESHTVGVDVKMSGKCDCLVFSATTARPMS